MPPFAFAIAIANAEYIPRSEAAKSYEKLLVYLTAAQLMLSNGAASVVPAAAGLFFGALAISGSFNVEKWRIPAPLRQAVKVRSPIAPYCLFFCWSA